MVLFKYKYKNYDESDKDLEYDIPIPYKDSVGELSSQIISCKMEPIMKYLDVDHALTIELQRFIKEENQRFYDRQDEELLNQARNGEIDVETIVQNLEKLYKEEVFELNDVAKVGPTDEEIFAQSFHSLVHSSSLPDILTKEKSYSLVISNLTEQMYCDFEMLKEQQQAEMNQRLEQLDITTTPEDINNLIMQHTAQQNLVQSQWSDQLESKKGYQKNEYKNWINNQVLKNILNEESLPTPMGNRSSMFTTQTPSLEESFTIHLGSQLKHMHNIRILSANVQELLHPLHQNESMDGLNISLGLYSSSLCGIVVLTPSGSINVDRDIVKNANMSTEFHFDSIDKQIEKIEQELKQIREESNGDSNSNAKLKPGDCFITKHSNLAQSQIIFHLVTDEQSSTEINSRHPVILGLRNILRTATRFDVSTMTIPALLRHEMTEEMTIAWCLRRAELVFKCTKGFMIELASELKGAELSTLQLLLPHNISEEMFNSLSLMVPQTFQVSNSKVLGNSQK